MAKKRNPKRVTDPRKLGGSIVGPGGPRNRYGVIIDDTRGVLLEHSTCALVETRNGEVILALSLEGRINKSPDRAEILYLLNGDGAAALISELLALGDRVGPEFSEALMRRVAKLDRESGKGDNGIQSE